MVRAADAALHAERDRRYSEVNIEREKALKIKETADLAALSLAREIQTYKDEKANELREQINRERNLYASKEDVQNAAERLAAVVAPLAEYVSGQQARRTGFTDQRAVLASIVSVVGVLLLVAAYLAGR